MNLHAPDLLIFGLMIAVIYFLMFLPKQREQQAFKKMIESLKKGDRVQTQAGMIGEVAAIKDDTVTLKFHDGVRIDFNKTAISRKAEEKAAVEAKA